MIITVACPGLSMRSFNRLALLDFGRALIFRARPCPFNAAERADRSFLFLSKMLFTVRSAPAFTGKEKGAKKKATRRDALTSCTDAQYRSHANSTSGDQRIRSARFSQCPSAHFSLPRSQVPISSCHRFFDVSFSKTEYSYRVLYFAFLACTYNIK